MQDAKDLKAWKIDKKGCMPLYSLETTKDFFVTAIWPVPTKERLLVGISLGHVLLYDTKRRCHRRYQSFAPQASDRFTTPFSPLASLICHDKKGQHITSMVLAGKTLKHLLATIHGAEHRTSHSAKCVKKPYAPISCFAYNRKQDQLFVGRQTTGYVAVVKLYPNAFGPYKLLYVCQKGISAMVYDEQHDQCIAASFDGHIYFIGDKSVLIIVHRAPIKCMCYEPSEHILIFGDRHGKLSVWDSQRGQCIHVFHVGDEVSAICYLRSEQKIFFSTHAKLYKQKGGGRVLGIRGYTRHTPIAIVRNSCRIFCPQHKQPSRPYAKPRSRERLPCPRRGPSVPPMPPRPVALGPSSQMWATLPLASPYHQQAGGIVLVPCIVWSPTPFPRLPAFPIAQLQVTPSQVPATLAHHPLPNTTTLAAQRQCMHHSALSYSSPFT